MLVVRCVSPTDSLSKELRNLVNASFENTLRSLGEEEFYYIGKHFDRKVTAVAASRIPWVRELALQMQALHELYLLHTNGEVTIADETINLLGATLFYFVNPHDVVPDHQPGKGYLDDAHVLNTCVSRLRKTNPEFVE